MREHIINTIVDKRLIDETTKVFINPSGRFVVGGPKGDAGLTGRKIIVDTYGGVARHGGGAFSGKDPTKVDRSGAYAARWVAKNIVKAGLADRCEFTLSYAIGVAHPTSMNVETFGTGKASDEAILRAVRKHFDLRPGAIIRDLELRRPIFKRTAAYGHFGQIGLDVPWERHAPRAGARGDSGVGPLGRRMDAIILVGGQGTRLRPLTWTRHKSLVPVANRPAIEHLFGWVERSGIERVLLALGQHNEDLAEAYPEGRYGGLVIEHVIERERLESGGAIRNAVQSAGIDGRFVSSTATSMWTSPSRKPFAPTRRLGRG